MKNPFPMEWVINWKSARNDGGYFDGNGAVNAALRRMAGRGRHRICSLGRTQGQDFAGRKKSNCKEYLF